MEVGAAILINGPEFSGCLEVGAAILMNGPEFSGCLEVGAPILKTVNGNATINKVSISGK